MDSGDITVRTGAADDAGLLAELGARTFFDAFAADNSKSDMDAYLARAFSREVQSRELNDGRSTFLIAERGATEIGYARLRTGSAPACVVGAAPVEIVRFYMDASWIGRGAARVLMRECLARAMAVGCDVVWLDVWDRNARAIRFYEKFGFAVVGEQDFVLGEDVQHDLLMSRRAR